MGLAFLHIIADGGHALAAALFAALAIWIARGRDAGLERRLLAVALLLTAFWALQTSFSGIGRSLSGVGETVRNAAWLLFMFVLLQRGEGRRTDHSAPVTAIYSVLGLLLLAQIPCDMIAHAISSARPQATELVNLASDTGYILRMMVAVGSLVLAHNLFAMSATEGRSRIGLLLSALVAMWTYDLILYAVAWFAGDNAVELSALRGLVMAALAGVIALGARSEGEWRLQLSRTVAFRSFSFIAVGLYAIALTALIMLVELTAGPYARMIEMAGLFAMAVAGLVLLPSARMRAMVKVQVAKHFFQHRYDYRVEWMRFADTIGLPGDDAAALNERVIKAVADITDSPAGLLLLRDEAGALIVQAQWNWPDAMFPQQALAPADAATLERSGWIIDLGGVRAGEVRHGVPAWMLSERRAWALVPLIHFGRLAGAILLASPAVGRRLDWEDFDMLRTAGRQVASYISEAQGQQALDDAQRFEEFNRRFAFIMHDIKNLVSQLSLLARNAERHADNPEFRADMLLTLRESVGRMNDMLARLSQHNKARPEEPRVFALRPLAQDVAKARERQHPVEVGGDDVDVLADPARTVQILSHLLQNAIEASPSGVPVILRIGAQADRAVVEVIDRGCGMTADFMRRELFKPFSSSKPGGFGIGAFEARELARAMNGRIDVESRVGEGSCFTLQLPLAKGARMMTERAA